MPGLPSLDRFLSLTWARAGISRDRGEDCTQDVYTIALDEIGPSGFARFLDGLRIDRESDDGRRFLRIIDRVKKRAQRERRTLEMPALGRADRSYQLVDDREAIELAISAVLAPHQIDLVRSVLSGERPGEYAERLGITPRAQTERKRYTFLKMRTFLAPSMIG